MHISMDQMSLTQVKGMDHPPVGINGQLGAYSKIIFSSFADDVIILKNKGLKDTELNKLEAFEIAQYIELNKDKFIREANENGCSALRISKKDSKLARSIQIFFNQNGEIKNVVVPFGKLATTGNFKAVKVGFIFDPANADPALVAISILKFDHKQEKELQGFIDEASLSELFSQTASPAFHGALIRESKNGGLKASMITEFFEKGTLKSCAGKLDYEELFAYSSQLVNLIGEVRIRGYIHRDVRLDNVVRNEKDVLKLIDWGISIHQDHPEKALELLAPSSIATPEVLHCRRAGELDFGVIDHKEDMWALGILLYQLKNGKAPSWVSLLTAAAKDTNQPSIEEIISEMHAFHEAGAKDLDHMDPIDQLIWHLLDPDPQSRWDQQQALEHLDQNVPASTNNDFIANLSYGEGESTASIFEKYVQTIALHPIRACDAVEEEPYKSFSFAAL